MIAHSASSSGPGLLMISSGTAILPMSCSSAPSSAARRVVLVEPHPLGDAHGQADHVLGVAARVLVVVLEQVAQQQRGPAVGAAELERVADARLALAREGQQQVGQRQHEQRGERRVRGRDRGQQPDGREQHVDAVGREQVVPSAARGGTRWQSQIQARKMTASVRICAASATHVDRPVVERGQLGAERDQHERGADAEPRVGDGEHAAAQRGPGSCGGRDARARISPAATSSGTTGVGSSSSIGTNTICVGTK